MTISKPGSVPSLDAKSSRDDNYNVSQYESVFVFILFENLSFLDLDMFLSQVREVSAIMSLN